MPPRKLFVTGSNARDRQPQKVVQNQWSDVFEDEPASDIPETAVAKARNCIARMNKVGPRNGSLLWWPRGTRFPAIGGRSGFQAHTEGRYIVSDSGNIFTPLDLGNQFGWDNGLYDEIVEYVSAQRVRRRDRDVNSGSDCFVQGKFNGWWFHSKLGKWLIHLGNELYVAQLRMGNFTRVAVFSRDVPSNTVSAMEEDQDYWIVQTSGGLFRVIDGNPPEAYSINTPVPNVRVESNTAGGERPYQYRYIYSVALIDDALNFDDREDQTTILTESGTNVFDSARRDWSTRYTDSPIGTGLETYGVLDGATLVAPWNNPDAAGSYLNLVDAAFYISINGLGSQEILVDLSHVAGTLRMEGVAERIQDAIRTFFPSATFEYLGGTGAHFSCTSGRQDGGSVSFATAGTSGTDVAADLGLTIGAGAVRSFPAVGSALYVPRLRVPIVPNTYPEARQWHWNKYVIYRTADLGSFGSRTLRSGRVTANSPDAFVWTKDLRIAASMIARRRNGIVEIRAGAYGEFEIADETCVVEFEDGSRVQILEGGYIDSKNARYRSAGDLDYYGDRTDWMAAELGNGRVARVNQVGNIISIYPGSSIASLGGFTQDDVRKPIWYPTGRRDYIRRVLSANRIMVYQDEGANETAISLDPTYRNYTDTLDDGLLLARQSGWLCRGRFATALPRSNVFAWQPGFALVARTNGKKVQYCQMQDLYRIHFGYYHREYQVITVEDTIEEVVEFPNRFAVMCSRSLHSGATGNTVEITIEGTFQTVFQIPTLEKVSEYGCANRGAIQKIRDGHIRFVTNQNEVRDFDGINLSEDIAEDVQAGMKRWTETIRSAVRSFGSAYSRLTGYILWLKPRS